MGERERGTRHRCVGMVQGRLKGASCEIKRGSDVFTDQERLRCPSHQNAD